jgi:hypothetical protein
VKRNPLIGIWWDNGLQTVAITHPVDQNSTGRMLVDSNHSHSESWPEVCRRLGHSPDVEYFMVPRGRVLFHSATGRGLIYHGQATTPERLAAVARVFHLTSWSSQLDDHYATGDDLDQIFNVE